MQIPAYTGPTTPDQSRADHVANVIIPALRANARVTEVHVVSEPGDPDVILGFLVDGAPISLSFNNTP